MLTEQPPVQRQSEIRSAIRGFYDLQKLRIATGQRIVSTILQKLNLPAEIAEKANETKEEKAFRISENKKRNEIIHSFLMQLNLSKKEDELETDIPDPDAEFEEVSIKSKRKTKINFADIVFKEYKNITDYMTSNHSSVRRALEEKGIGIISTESEMDLLDSYNFLDKAETRLIKPIERLLDQHPLWNGFLNQVKGCGPLMGAIIISEFDIDRARYVSSFWKYSGYDSLPEPVLDENGEQLIDEKGDPVFKWMGRSRRREHLEEKTYIDKYGEEQTKMGITFNPFLKTKLHVLATCFIRSRSYYADVYNNYKHRISNMDEHQKKSKPHIDAMAKRYMLKYFMQDLFTAWCFITGRTPARPFHEEKLNRDPHPTSPYLYPVLEEYAPDWIVGPYNALE